MLEWAVLGALMLGIVIFCARVMRRGLTTLDDDRKHCLEKIRQGEKRLAEDRKNMAAWEHLQIMRAAMEDLIRLEGSQADHMVRSVNNTVELATPDGVWQVELAMRERNLRTTHRALHGRARWLLKGFGHYEEHADPATLMRSLSGHLHARDRVPGEPEHLARRLRALHSVPRKS